MTTTLGTVTKAHRRRTPHRIVAMSVAALLLGSVMARAEQVASALGAPNSNGGDQAAPAAPHKMDRSVRLASLDNRQLPRRSHVVVAAPATRVRQVSANTSYDVPLAAMQAYRQAAAVLRRSAPNCHLQWPLLAAIGQVESDHGRYGGAQVLADGSVSPSIVGPPLDGRGGRARIADTDNGRLDGDTRWDRAVGPMQFLPSTWAVIGVDANQDGMRDPNNFNDAALAAGTYLCAMSGDLRKPANLQAAVFSYNHSQAYVDLVLKLARAYSHGAAHLIGDYLPAAPSTTANTASSQAAADGPVKSHQPARQSGGHSSPAPHHSSGSSPSPSASPTTSVTTGAQPTQPQPTSTSISPSGPPSTAPTSPVQTTPTAPVTTSPVPTAPVTTTPVTTKPTGPANTEPTTTTKPTPSPTTTTPPPLTTFTGILATCDGGWCLAGDPVDLGTEPDLSVVQADYNGDGDKAPVAKELESLLGKRVTMQTDQSRLVVTINSLPYVVHESTNGGGITPTGGMPTS